MADTVFRSLDFWDDLVPRSAEEALAVDLSLAGRLGDRPILRVYRWAEPAVSTGYFGSWPDDLDAGVTKVRRMTGGGFVDHRDCQTYSLIVPRSERLAQQRASESYCVIHRAVAKALSMKAHVLSLDWKGGAGSGQCAMDAVPGDVVCEVSGRKLAGAGQKRTRSYFLHQGCVWAEIDLSRFGETLAEVLAETWERVAPRF